MSNLEELTEKIIEETLGSEGKKIFNKDFKIKMILKILDHKKEFGELHNLTEKPISDMIKNLNSSNFDKDALLELLLNQKAKVSQLYLTHAIEFNKTFGHLID